MYGGIPWPDPVFWDTSIDIFYRTKKKETPRGRSRSTWLMRTCIPAHRSATCRAASWRSKKKALMGLAPRDSHIIKQNPTTTVCLIPYQKLVSVRIPPPVRERLLLPKLALPSSTRQLASLTWTLEHLKRTSWPHVCLASINKLN
jgi:hypothetical protein